MKSTTATAGPSSLSRPLKIDPIAIATVVELIGA
jgi:hypothetical protein